MMATIQVVFHYSGETMRPSKNARVVVVALIASTLSAAAEGAYFLSATGGAGMPLGADSSLFSVATGGNLEGGFVLMQSPRLLVGPGLSYTSSPLKSSGTLQTIEAHAGVELAFELFPRFTAGACAKKVRRSARVRHHP
jgi:hypothetical protein